MASQMATEKVVTAAVGLALYQIALPVYFQGRLQEGIGISPTLKSLHKILIVGHRVGDHVI